MKIPYNILIQIKMSVRPYFKGFTLIFFFYNCRKQDYSCFPWGLQGGVFRQLPAQLNGNDPSGAALAMF